MFLNLQMRGGARKSIPRVGEASDSGPRHVRARCVAAAARREREAERQQMHAAQFEQPGGDRVDHFTAEPEPEQSESEEFVQMDVAYSTSEDSSDSGVVHRVKKGRDGRFVGTASTSGKFT